jgi:hypothetical protein
MRGKNRSKGKKRQDYIDKRIMICKRMGTFHKYNRKKSR